MLSFGTFFGNFCLRLFFWEIQVPGKTVVFCLQHVIHVVRIHLSYPGTFSVHPVIRQIFSNAAGLKRKLYLALCPKICMLWFSFRQFSQLIRNENITFCCSVQCESVIYNLLWILLYLFIFLLTRKIVVNPQRQYVVLSTSCSEVARSREVIWKAVCEPHP